jgi:excisionase family DNA binding protein
MDANKVVRFEDMPKVLSSLLKEVQQLHSKVDSINSVVNQKQEKPNRILSIQEVSKMIHKSTSTVYKMVSKSVIPCYKQGKTVTFIEDEILEWMKQYKRGSATEMMALAEQYLQRIQ